ncbi:MAG: hypothetical protein U5R31_16485 [Acidimicrobiia bacterium]|nr:hypothetical protein [Acidimicrobiia bacterium]
MIGPIIILVVLFVAIPVGVLVTGVIVAGVLGWSFKDDVESEHEGSELIALNR